MKDRRLVGIPLPKCRFCGHPQESHKKEIFRPRERPCRILGCPCLGTWD